MKDSIYNILVWGSLGVLMLMENGCSGNPSRGSPEYVREQVYMCRQLCANAEVNITKIEGLDCVCNKPQQPMMIYNPIVTGASAGGGGSSSSGSTSGSGGMMAPAQAPQPIVINTHGQSEEPALIQKANATVVQDATGRTIISQTK